MCIFSSTVDCWISVVQQHINYAIHHVLESEFRVCSSNQLRGCSETSICYVVCAQRNYRNAEKPELLTPPRLNTECFSIEKAAPTSLKFAIQVLYPRITKTSFRQVPRPHTMQNCRVRNPSRCSDQSMQARTRDIVGLIILPSLKDSRCTAPKPDRLLPV